MNEDINNEIIMDLSEPTPTAPAKEEATPTKAVENVEQFVSVFEDCAWDENAETIPFPSVTSKEFIQAIEKIPNMAMDSSEQEQLWVEAARSGASLTTFDDALVSTAQDPDAHFMQFMKVGDNKVGPSKVKLALAAGPLSGERATISMMNALGIGSLASIPLWHSGFWVTFKAPLEAAWLELQRQLVSDKITMGRRTYGLIYSGTTSYTIDRLVDFALSHIYRTTVSGLDNDKNKLRSLISCHDIYPLILGVLCSAYPNGFQYRRACLNDPEKCNHVVEEKINLFKIQWLNNEALTQWQMGHMAARQPDSMTLDNVKRYQQEHLKGANRRVKIQAAMPIEFELKVPNISEYVSSGERWIDNITNMVTAAVGMDASITEKNDYIVKHSQATALRQYAHWIKQIDIGANEDDKSYIDELGSIESNLNVLSAEDKIRTELIEQIGKYIDESCISLVGIPTYECPACGVDQKDHSHAKDKYPKFTSIIPIDVVQTFFPLLVQRTNKIQNR